MIRCLVVDDSRTFRAVLRRILAHGDIEVVGEAEDGHQALARIVELRPDVITMDVRMPGRDGLATLEEIMAVRPTPVIVISAEAGPERQGLAFRALDAGAIEVLPKPRADVPGRYDREAEAIRSAVRAVAGLTLVTRRRKGDARRPAAPPPPAPPPVRPGAAAAGGAAGTGPPRAAPPVPAPGGPARPALTPWPGALAAVLAAPPRPSLHAPRVIGVGASTGGPPALARILGALPASFPVPLLVVQHIAAGFEDGLVHWLGAVSPLSVKVAEDREPLRPGTVYLAPADRHLGAAAGQIRLSAEPPVHGFRPSATALFATLAREYGAAAGGVVLTGMGEDGAAGLRALRERGGWTAAQGPASSVVYGMPRAAVERGGAERTLELDEVAPALLALAAGPGTQGPGGAASAPGGAGAPGGRG
jgi:two-component system chemotaxis response regulator CheB